MLIPALNPNLPASTVEHLQRILVTVPQCTHTQIDCTFVFTFVHTIVLPSSKVIT